MNETLIITNQKEWQDFFKSISYSKLVVLTDKNTHEYCLPIVQSSYVAQDSLHYTIDQGEANKTLEQSEKFWEWLIDHEVDRNAVLICLGGGMLTDLGGFVASTYKRGIRTVYFPTTNLAMCDAAIGGKTGVNFSGIKNQIGTFYNPLAVVIDTAMLKSLSQRQINSGYIETLKHALIGNKPLWQSLLNNELDITSEGCIKESMQVKLDIVAKDFNDEGLRHALNFGHTLGHALESNAGSVNKPILHGEAVAYGIVAETWLSTRLCGLNEQVFNDVRSHIEGSISLPNIDFIDATLCLELMQQDKKNSNGKVRCALIEDIGKPKTGIEVDEALLRQAIDIMIESAAK